MPKVLEISKTVVYIADGITKDCYLCIIDGEPFAVHTPMECPVDVGDFLWVYEDYLYWSNIKGDVVDIKYYRPDKGWNTDGTKSPKRVIFDWAKEYEAKGN